jgi:hypothetical protein
MDLRMVKASYARDPSRFSETMASNCDRILADFGLSEAEWEITAYRESRWKVAGCDEPLPPAAYRCGRTASYPPGQCGDRGSAGVLSPPGIWQGEQ